MIEPTSSKDIAAAQKRVMRAWTKLELKRDHLITSLRGVEQEMTAMDPMIKSLFPGRERQAA